MPPSHPKLKQKIQRALQLNRALKLIWQSSPTWTIARLILLTIQSILPLLSLYLMKVIIDTVQVGAKNIGDIHQLFPR